MMPARIQRYTHASTLAGPPTNAGKTVNNCELILQILIGNGMDVQPTNFIRGSLLLTGLAPFRTQTITGLSLR